MFYPQVSEDRLIRELSRLREIHEGDGGRWPEWAQDSAASILKDKKFIVCGSERRAELRVLAKHANVIAVVDDMVVAQGGDKVSGIDVIDSDAWVTLANNDKSVVSVLLVSGTAAYQHFCKIAMQWNLQTLKPLQYLHLLKTCGVHRTAEAGRFFHYGEEFFQRTLDHLDHLIASRKQMGDSWSRLSWLCVLLYRLTLNPFYLTACAVGYNTEKFGYNSYEMNRRFFRFSEQEVYVDGGAFTGDTIAQFVRAVDGRFRHIHSFEPSSENNQAIRSLLSGLQEDYSLLLQTKITLHEKGLWDRDATLLFNPCQLQETEGEQGVYTPASAHLVDGGVAKHVYDKQQESAASIQVPVTSLDAATGGDATFIKLEIEGAESEALHGARETIARNRPKMAIAMYHKPEDLETLLDFVLRTGHDYRLGFRQHNPLCPDAMVLYCS
jgi:FkbM family methyltransferase